MWGQVRFISGSTDKPRIIPTRVGTSLYICVRFSHKQDHPHACGDKERRLNNAKRTKGSSPRVWGQAHLLIFNFGIGRIIPTRVGTRPFPQAASGCSEDHPHACGDKQDAKITKILQLGSSPRVWGQAFIRKLFALIGRIIPTRVGTRLKKSRKIAVLQNQPLRFPLTFHRSFV